MTEILAAIENSRASREVLDTARRLAGVLGTHVEAVYAHENDDSVAAAVAREAGLPLRVLIGEPATAILRALEHEDVILGAVGTGRYRTRRHPLGVVTREVVTRARKPIVVVPPEPARPDPGPGTVVVPLDGAAGAAGEEVRSVLGRLAGGGAEVVALHVFDATDAPRYWDHYYYDFPAWCEDFWARHRPPATAHLELGWGPLVPEVLRVAEGRRAALIAIPWSQDVASGEGAMVTELLRTTRTPVLLVPEPTALQRPDARELTSAV